jgi:outer membrane protein assembly factor BamA
VIIRFFALFIVLTFISLETRCASDTTDLKKVRVLPVPAFGYSPETKSYFGFVALATINLYQDENTRVSNAKIEFNYTGNKQLITELGWNYFSKNEKYFYQGLLHYSKYPDRYYGIGAQAADENELLFESRRFNLDLSILSQQKYGIFFGPRIRHIKYDQIDETHQNSFPELRDQQLSSLGFVALLDKRNNLLNATTGHYFYFNPNYTNGSDHKGYWKLILDARRYFTINDKITVASRIYQESNGPGVTFYDHAVAGGDKFVRGYFFGRHRNKQLSTLQLELRGPIFWRIGLAVFGGYSAIYQNNWNESEALKANFGGGLRFLVDKKENINLRLDYAIGQNGQSGFYVAFGESF